MNDLLPSLAIIALTTFIPANVSADAVIRVSQVGACTSTSDCSVVAEVLDGSTLYLGSLTDHGTATRPARINPSDAFIRLADNSGSSVHRFGESGEFLMAPTFFGGGGVVDASSGTGLGLAAAGEGAGLGQIAKPGPFIEVPTGYAVGTPLSGTAIWNSATFASLQITPGDYVWKWSTGSSVETLTVSVVPEPSAFLYFCLICIGISAAKYLRPLRP